MRTCLDKTNTLYCKPITRNQSVVSWTEILNKTNAALWWRDENRPLSKQLNDISSTLSMNVAIFKSMFKVVRVDIFTITILRIAYIIEIQQDMKEVLR